MKRVKVYLFAAVVLTIGMATQFNVTAADKTEIRIGVLPSLAHLPVVLSAKEVAFPLEQAKVTIDIYNSWTALEAAFRTNAVDMAALTLPKVLNMAFDGVPLRIILVLSRNGSSILLKEDAASSLKNKITGNSGSDTMELAIFKEFIQSKNLKFGYDVRSILIPIKRSVQLFDSGRIFGFCLPSPYGYIAQQKSQGKLILSGEIMPYHINSVLIVNPAVWEKKKTAIAEVVRSIIVSGEFIEKDKEDSGGMQTAVAQEEVFKFSAKLVAKALSQPKERVVFSNMKLDVKELNQTMEDLVKIGVVKGRVNINKIIIK